MPGQYRPAGNTGDAVQAGELAQLVHAPQGAEMKQRGAKAAARKGKAG